ncbi:hypothetical protein MTO96_013957 [Rhipicephalus appendiculatus]
MSALLIRVLFCFARRSGRGPSGADAATCGHKAALGNVLNDRLILRNYRVLQQQALYAPRRNGPPARGERGHLPGGCATPCFRKRGRLRRCVPAQQVVCGRACTTLAAPN